MPGVSRAEHEVPHGRDMAAETSSYETEPRLIDVASSSRLLDG
jgi:hypothetical protein